MNNEKLEELLSQLKSERPNDFQMKRWKRATTASNPSRSFVARLPWIQLIAATIVGVIVGGLIFGGQDQAQTWQDIAENDEDYATVEYIFNKTN